MLERKTADRNVDISKLGLMALVVDDDAGMRTLVRRLLQRMKVGSKECGDGREALGMLETTKFDFALCDLNMKILDGIGFVTSVRNLPDMRLQVLPVIMITGNASRIAVNSARDAGINEVLVKPFTEGGLQARIKEVILRPRPFVFGPTYYGPCRRRRTDERYRGPERRKNVSPVEI